MIYKQLEKKIDQVLEKLDDIHQKHTDLDKEFYKYRSDMDRLLIEHSRCVIQPEKIKGIEDDVKDLYGRYNLLLTDVKEEVNTAKGKKAAFISLKEGIILIIAILGVALKFIK